MVKLLGNRSCDPQKKKLFTIYDYNLMFISKGVKTEVTFF